VKKKFNTKVIHSGHGPDKETGAVMPPIHLSSTFKQMEPGNFEYEYARTKNPSRDILEKITGHNWSLEIKLFAFASGMSANKIQFVDHLGTNYHIGLF
jgi:Cystathionine beta-lyases/cystathionine gamma-synthases